MFFKPSGEKLSEGAFEVARERIVCVGATGEGNLLGSLVVLASGTASAALRRPGKLTSFAARTLRFDHSLP